MKTILQGIKGIEERCFQEPWSESVLGECLGQSHYIWETATDEIGLIVAYACGSISFDEGEILRVAVLPEYRRQGLGEKVLGGILQKLEERGVEKVFLEVRASNEPAKALYGKMGFTTIGIRKGYYPGGEDAVIMEKM